MIGKEIQKILIDKDMRKGTLAKQLGWSQSNLYNKFRRDNFTEKDLKLIAEALNCELKIEFVPKEELL